MQRKEKWPTSKLPGKLHTHALALGPVGFMGYRTEDLKGIGFIGYMVSGFRVYRVYGLGFSGFRIEGLGFIGYRVEGLYGL